jgi:outer membrane protein assembly factor BamD (BamD/ComL family)
LDKLQAQFPKGVLLQEREVLAIEVLHARGNVEAARQRAKAFIAAYPKSPHSQTLVRFVN